MVAESFFNYDWFQVPLSVNRTCRVLLLLFQVRNWWWSIPNGHDFSRLHRKGTEQLTFCAKVIGKCATFMSCLSLLEFYHFATSKSCFESIKEEEESRSQRGKKRRELKGEKMIPQLGGHRYHKRRERLWKNIESNSNKTENMLK